MFVISALGSLRKVDHKFKAILRNIWISFSAPPRGLLCCNDVIYDQDLVIHGSHVYFHVTRQLPVMLTMIQSHRIQTSQ